MKRHLALLLVLSGAVFAQAQPNDLIHSIVQIEAGQTTNDLVTPDPFDIYQISITNSNASPASLLEMAVTGDLLGFGDTTFKADAENPVIFGFEAPDTFFIVPDETEVLTSDVEDSPTRLAARFQVLGGDELVPGGGVTTPIMTVSVPAGSPFSLPLVSGRALVDGEFVCVRSLGGPEVSCDIPEPAAGLLAAIGAAGVPLRRRW